MLAPQNPAKLAHTIPLKGGVKSIQQSVERGFTPQTTFGRLIMDVLDFVKTAEGLAWPTDIAKCILGSLS